jgi:hypothetical protein
VEALELLSVEGLDPLESAEALAEQLLLEAIELGIL